MKKIIFSSEFFNIKDTLNCGQIFRFREYKKGYLITSLDKSFYCYNENDLAVIECEEADEEYVKNFFDLSRNYKAIYESALDSKIEILLKASERGKGIRILNQDLLEMVFSFIISQNNNIPRIKKIIEKLCIFRGEKKTFLGEEYFAFPKLENLVNLPLEFYKEIGLGYRSEYILNLVKLLNEGLDFNAFKSLEEEKLYKNLVKIKGIGPKVAECIMLFGYHKERVFPVDTWIEKVYRENFNGNLKSIKEISEYFVNRFKDNSGYFQQYLFYYKRSIEGGRE